MDNLILFFDLIIKYKYMYKNKYKNIFFATFLIIRNISHFHIFFDILYLYKYV